MHAAGNKMGKLWGQRDVLAHAGKLHLVAPGIPARPSSRPPLPLAQLLREGPLVLRHQHLTLLFSMSRFSVTPHHTTPHDIPGCTVLDMAHIFE